jgi:hypothetical protein
MAVFDTTDSIWERWRQENATSASYPNEKG